MLLKRMLEKPWGISVDGDGVHLDRFEKQKVWCGVDIVTLPFIFDAERHHMDS